MLLDRPWSWTGCWMRCSWLLCERQDRESPGRGDPLIDRVIEQLHANPRRTISVEAMARSGALSRAAFSQRFSRRTGLGPGAYQRRLRLAWAADELRATARTVAAVGEEAGYGSPASFSSAFKQEYGQSPHSWRTLDGRGAAGREPDGRV